MKLIDEIVEIIEEYKDKNCSIDAANPAIIEFLNYSPNKVNDKADTDIIKQSVAPVQYNKNTYMKPNQNIQQKKNLFVKEQDAPVYQKAEPISGDYHNMQLDQLRQFVLSCKNCSLCKGRSNVVFGEGNPNADLLFIGEAPGRDEDLQGKPFVGKSGQLLTKMIKAMGYDRSEVYIANIIKCRPPYNRNPSPEEAKYCIGFLNRQIELIKPKVLVLLGAVPLQFLLGLSGITRLRGQWKEYNGIKVMPTFHPAYLLRDPRQKRPAWEDLQKVMKVLGKLKD